MTTLLSACTLSVLLCATCAAQPAHRIHVSVQGDDAHSGTAAQPLATLRAARDAVRALKAEGLRGPVEVVVGEGVYHLAEPLVLEPDDSGTAEAPVTWRAAEGADVALSGGVPVTGWRQEGGLWAADVPEGLDFRLLRVGHRWATRARHPNFDPENPRTGGWLFADYGGKPWERGALNVGVSNVHNVGATLAWRIRAPAAGTYRMWLRYGHRMTDYGVPDMGGRTTMQVGDGEPILLENLPDTGGWNPSAWSLAAELPLAEGENLLAWVNRKGGGLYLDAFALTDDPEWDPSKAISAPAWWGAFRVQDPAEGRHVLIVQCEACETAEGPEIIVHRSTPPGTMHHMNFREGDLPAWQDVSGAEVHVFIAWGWVNAIVPVASIDHARRRIQFAEGHASQDVRMGNRYFIENVREALDAPGEWYLDRERGRVLHIPDNSRFPDVPVVAPVLDRLIVMQGDAETGRFVEHVHIEGFRFTDTNHAVTTDYYTPQDAALWLSAARHCEVRNCRFEWCGGYAVRLEQRSRECRLVRNDIRHMGQGGVIFVGNTADQARHCHVLGNTMQYLGLIYKHVAGVYGVQASDTRVAHNQIWDVPRYAISFKGHSDDRLSHRNVIEFNDLRRANLETNDTGIIETLGRERRDSGNVIRHNLLLDSVGMITSAEGEILTPYFSWGVYLDDYSSGTTVYGNIIARNVNGGGCIHAGRNNVFENNIMVEGRDHQFRCQPRDDFMQGNRFVNNIVVYSRPEAHLMFSWRDKRDMFAEVDRNVYFLRGHDLTALKSQVFPAGTWNDWREAGFDLNSVAADPLFLDPDNDDYRLHPDSPALPLGFQPIPVERIGPQGLEED
ncbi:MAG: right-handed parallel beta-helix repeat-containing protein [Thermoguttaceae bacterium]|jgi:hypothetical protein|nr:right-handed parallel beta-helix repeat-containing protein [Thermoguttaceae bacterium]